MRWRHGRHVNDLSHARIRTSEYDFRTLDCASRLDGPSGHDGARNAPTFERGRRLDTPAARMAHRLGWSFARSSLSFAQIRESHRSDSLRNAISIGAEVPDITAQGADSVVDVTPDQVVERSAIGVLAPLAMVAPPPRPLCAGSIHRISNFPTPRTRRMTHRIGSYNAPAGRRPACDN